MRIAIYTLGCKVNQFESQAMEHIAGKRGHEIVRFGEAADAVIVNTCTVTATADGKSRRAVMRARRTYPGAVVAVCGCMTQNAGADAKAALGADIVTGNRDHAALLDAITGYDMGCGAPHNTAAFTRLPAGVLSTRTRGLLKIQDGCGNGCAYCVIPQVRGPVRSLPPDEAVSEAVRMCRAGCLELILTGIEISSYGSERGDVSLADITARICRETPGMRVHLGSLNPEVIDERFCETLSGCDNLCRHFHISLQSGSDTVLARMGRRYDTARVRKAMRLLRGVFPDAAFSADIICGFPGESEAEFRESLAFAETCRFCHMHIFPYSQREGTAAAGMAGQVPHAVKRERCALADVLMRAMKARCLDAYTGCAARVLFEREAEPGILTGHDERGLPVRVRCGAELRGELREVCIRGRDGDSLLGELR